MSTDTETSVRETHQSLMEQLTVLLSSKAEQGDYESSQIYAIFVSKVLGEEVADYATWFTDTAFDTVKKPEALDISELSAQEIEQEVLKERCRIIQLWVNMLPEIDCHLEGAVPAVEQADITVIDPPEDYDDQPDEEDIKEADAQREQENKFAKAVAMLKKPASPQPTPNDELLDKIKVKFKTLGVVMEEFGDALRKVEDKVESHENDKKEDAASIAALSQRIDQADAKIDQLLELIMARLG